MKVTRCPQLEITPDVWRLLDAADFARKGVLPLPGGLLSQTATFVRFCRVAWNEVDATRAELRLGAADDL